MIKTLRSLLALLLLLTSISAHAAYAYVQSAAPAVQSGLTATASLTGVVSGNYLIIGIKVSSENRTISSVSNGTDTFSVGANSALVANGTNSTSIYYVKTTVSGSVTVTVTFDASSASAVYLVLAEYSGIASASAFDIDANAFASAASVSPSLTTTNQPDAIILWSFSGTASRPLSTPTGLTFNTRQDLTTPQLLFADARSTATGAQSITQAVTGGNSGLTAIALALKETAAGGGTVVNPLNGKGGAAAAPITLQ